MSLFLPSIFRPVYLQDEASTSTSTSSNPQPVPVAQKSKKAKLSWDEEQYQHQIPAPHLPGEGRFQITAKVSLVANEVKGGREANGKNSGQQNRIGLES